MSWLNLSRAATILALLCFLTPWFAISCQQTEVVSATGIQLATGTVHAPDESTRDQGAAVWALLALFMLGASAVLVTAFAKNKDRLRIVSFLCGGAALLLAGGMLLTVDSAKRELVSSRGGGSVNVDSAMRQLAAQGIRLEVKSGFWLALLLSAGASATAYLAFLGRPAPSWAAGIDLKSARPAGSLDLSRWTPASFGAPPDQRYWDGMTDKSDPDALEEYLTRFPEGQFAELARTRLLRAGREPPAGPPPSAPPGPGALRSTEPGPGPEAEAAEAASGHAETSAPTATVTAATAPGGCPACGAARLDSAKFCTECGHRLPEDDGQ